MHDCGLFTLTLIPAPPFKSQYSEEGKQHRKKYPKGMEGKQFAKILVYHFPHQTWWFTEAYKSLSSRQQVIKNLIKTMTPFPPQHNESRLVIY